MNRAQPIILITNMKSHPTMNTILRYFPKLAVRRSMRFGTIICWIVLETFSVNSLQAGVASEITERVIRLGGHTVDDSGRIAARNAVESGIARFGEEVAVLTELGGYGLADAAARHGDEVWRLARLSPEAPRALACRAESLIGVANRWGDEAVRLEVLSPACGEMLAGSLTKKTLSNLAANATVPEIQRFATLAAHVPSRELEATVTIWNRTGSRVLQYLTPARIASLGFAGALITASWRAPEAAIGLAEISLKGFLGPLVTICSWLLVLVILTYLRKPLVWLVGRGVNLCHELWRAIGKKGGSQPLPKI